MDIAIRTANLARENRYLKVSCPWYILLAYERDLKVMVGITLVFVPRICRNFSTDVTNILEL